MNKAMKGALAVLVLVSGMWAAYAVAVSGRGMAGDRPVEAPPSVRTASCVPGPVEMTVEGRGLVRAGRNLPVTPMVSGQVSSVSPKLVPGGRFKEGETLFTLDPADLSTTLSKAVSDRDAAWLALLEERASGRTARWEWDRSGEEGDGDMARRVPHEAAALSAWKAAVEAADKAARDVERATVKAPFDLVVVSSDVVSGGYVQAGQSVSETVGTRPLFADLAVPSEKAADVLPGPVTVDVEGRMFPGRVDAVSGVIDAGVNDVMVTVRLDGGIDDGILAGQRAVADLPAGTAGGACVLPASAVMADGTVWIVEDGRLKSVSPAVVRSDAGSVAVTGIAGARVVTSVLAAPVDGLVVREEAR